MEVTRRTERIRAAADKMLGRLEAEVRALVRRGNLNMVWGTSTTFAAAAILGYAAATLRIVGENWRAYLPTYLLRLSVVVFIEIFAFFFLRLYRANLADIKYFQNEITNLEAKCLALEFAILSADAKSAEKVVVQLACTERNFILKKMRPLSSLRDRESTRRVFATSPQRCETSCQLCGGLKLANGPASHPSPPASKH